MRKAPSFPSFKVRAFIVFWRALWWVATPVVLIYLWRRGRADALYGMHLGERFGRHRKRNAPHVWVHAVSIGELRSAVPLINALLAQGEHVVTTHFTPAGRSASQDIFAEHINAGQLSAVWVPFDYGAAFKRFFKAFQPKYGLVMEVEFWPGMIMASRKHHVPLFLCNGQYPSRSFERDRMKRFSRADLVPGFAGVMVKSQRQADRFAGLGVKNIAITGEMRFEQPIPQTHINAGAKVRGALAQGRQVIGFASVVKGEDEIFIAAMKAWPAADRPLCVYIPRAPERFDETMQRIENAGFRAARRSDVLDENLALHAPCDTDVLVGDSLGEMYFYLSLCDKVLVGGGFTAKGSHNISEPLALGKPVLVGPETWTIEFPVEEAIAAGVCKRTSENALLADLMAPPLATETAIKDFMTSHGGAVARTLGAVADFLTATSR